MIQVQLENDIRRIVETKGQYSILEYLRDASVSVSNAATEYFMQQMGVHRRQVVCQMDGSVPVVIQAGAMQWFTGGLQTTTGIKGAGDFLGKMVKGAVTKESAIKPEYVGQGILVLEPTYKHLLLEDVSTWGSGLVVEDGMFLACDGSIKRDVIARSSISSAVAGREGLFNLCLRGSGIAVLESNVPRNELIEINLENDEIKIDGNMAVCWSETLKFTVERSSKSLIGSAASGEGLVNVYRGTGKILMSPVALTSSFIAATQ